MKNITILIACLMLTGCYTEKKAAKQTVKAFAEYPALVSGYCGTWFDPVVITKDSFIYKPGKTIYKKGEPVFVEVDCDSVTKSNLSSHSSPKANYVKIPCPPCDSVRIDTAYVSTRNTEVNRALETQLRIERDNALMDAEKHRNGRNTWRWIAIILGAYTLLRWALRYFTKGVIKLPLLIFALALPQLGYAHDTSKIDTEKQVLTDKLWISEARNEVCQMRVMVLMADKRKVRRNAVRYWRRDNHNCSPYQ